MPEIKVQKIVSFSSEDKNHPASNLLRPDGAHKWKCAAAGEKSVSTILQFDTPEQVQSVDIGNEGSAFIEVLVGRSTSPNPDTDFQVILVASSFMTPMDSRNGTNRNSVRMFGPDKLSKTVSDQKWDRIKVVCTQPFNKTSTYGLSFIKFHSTPSASTEPPQPKKTFGVFSIRDEADKGGVTVGSLFADREKHKTEPAPPTTGAAAVRAASKAAEQSYSTVRESKPTHSPSQHSHSSSQHQSNSKRRHSNDEEKTSEKKSRKSSSDTKPPEQAKKQETAKVATPQRKDKPPADAPSAPKSAIMKGVTFVLSGYQNPQRADIRDKAVEMGGVYKPDWGPGCTHLICAFANTPKYTAVEGKGKIVGKSWITESYKHGRRLPWRKFRVGDAESPNVSSDEDKPTNTATSPSPSPHIPKVDMSDSGDDTDDELNRIKDADTKTKTPPKKSPVKKGDPDYEISTDEDVKSGEASDDDSNGGLPSLPDFFTDKTFFLYGDFSPAERRALLRYITAYNGILDAYMTDKVNYVLTYSTWDSNFEDIGRRYNIYAAEQFSYEQLQSKLSESALVKLEYPEETI